MQASFYETDKAVSEYLLFHYGSMDDLLLDGIGPQEALGFARRCGQLHAGHAKETGRALDLGCAVGAAAFAMSETFDTVVAIDYSHALIEAAQSLSQNGRATISFAQEGELMRQTEIHTPKEANPDRIEFMQGDAMNLSPELGQFDFVLMANLIDRLPDPARCLASIHELLNPNGVLAITSPYTWLEEYTPRSKWLGGFIENGVAVRTHDRLIELLGKHLELVDTQNLPFLIREHDRKNQYSIAEATIWKKSI